MRSRNLALNAERRDAILSAAADCFVDRGFHATSMKDVCAAAGMSPGTLYHYFASKTEIIGGIIEQEGQLVGELLAPLADTNDFFASFFRVLDSIASQITMRDLTLHAEIEAEVLRDPALKKRAQKYDEAQREDLRTAIIAAQKAGQIDQRLDPSLAATSLIALIDGLLAQAALHGLKELKRHLPATKQAVARMLVDPSEVA